MQFSISFLFQSSDPEDGFMNDNIVAYSEKNKLVEEENVRDFFLLVFFVVVFMFFFQSCFPVASSSGSSLASCTIIYLPAIYLQFTCNLPVIYL